MSDKIVKVPVSLKPLIDDYKYSTVSDLFKLFPKYDDENSYNDYTIELTVKRDENPLFVNLFGLTFNYNNGDIILGTYINTDTYIYSGNIYALISNIFFNSERIPDYVNVGGIIEPLKVDIKNCVELIKDNVKSDFKEYYTRKNCKSITLSLINNIKIELDKDTNVGYFERNFSEDTVIKLLSICNKLAVALMYIGNSIFNKYISESTEFEVRDNLNKIKNKKINSTKEITKSLNTAYYFYLKKNLNKLFLISMYSYVIGNRCRKNSLINIKTELEKDNINKDYIYLEVLKSNFSCFDNTRHVSYDDLVAYNIIDLVYSINAIQDYLFTYEYNKYRGNSKLLSHFLTQKDIRTLCNKSNIEMGKFLDITDKYFKDILINIDSVNVSVNTVHTKMSGVFIGHKTLQLNHALPICEDVFSKINNIFNA